MAAKFIVMCTFVAVARAGLVGAPATYAPGPQVQTAGIAYSSAPAVSHFSYSSPVVSYGQPFAAQTPAITSQSSNILRSFGNLGQVSTYSKTIDTPFSSVSKSDVRVSNPGYTTYAAAAPAVHTTYAAAPLARAAYVAPAVHTTYAAAPAVHTTYAAAPAVHTTYAAAPALHTTYAAAPALHATYAAPTLATTVHHAPAVVRAAPAVAAAPGLLGVAYSAAPVVSHMSYSSGPINYAW